MSIKNITVTGGRINFQKLTLKLQKENQKEFEIGKIITWLSMLNRGQKPKRWNKPTKNGSAVTFETISNQTEYDTALGELQGYTNSINREYGTDLKFKKEA